MTASEATRLILAWRDHPDANDRGAKVNCITLPTRARTMLMDLRNNDHTINIVGAPRGADLITRNTQILPGDMIYHTWAHQNHMNSPGTGHHILVTSVSADGNTITVADGGVGGNGVQWGRTVTRDWLIANNGRLSPLAVRDPITRELIRLVVPD
jgi:hypothetical protein